MQLAVAGGTHCRSPHPHCTPNGKSHSPRTAVCSETHDCPCSRSRHSQQEPHCPCCFTGVIVMLRALPLHFIQELSLCDFVKGSFTTSLCVIVAFQTNVSFSELILSQVDGLVDVGRQASGGGRSHDLSAELENPGSTQVPHAPRLGDDVQVLADADVALVTALDRRDIGCARDGVVILGHGATVLRHHVWEMSTP